MGTSLAGLLAVILQLQDSDEERGKRAHTGQGGRRLPAGIFSSLLYPSTVFSSTISSKRKKKAPKRRGRAAVHPVGKGNRLSGASHFFRDALTNSSESFVNEKGGKAVLYDHAVIPIEKGGRSSLVRQAPSSPLRFLFFLNHVRKAIPNGVVILPSPPPDACERKERENEP